MKKNSVATLIIVPKTLKIEKVCKILLKNIDIQVSPRKLNVREDSNTVSNFFRYGYIHHLQDYSRLV